MRATTALPIIIIIVILALASPALAGEKITLSTADGLEIVGTFYASGRKGAAGVVALPMYRHDRTTYEPVAERFTKAGMDFLAIDMRGHGESAVQGEEDLSERVKARDPKLFSAMWQDALAARTFLIGKGTDPNRIGLLGASVGCSVAIDAASRTERILGACVMTPGKNYLGVNTMGDLAAYGDRPLLILSSKEEAGVGAKAIKAKLGVSAELVLFEEKGVHGTKMFGKVAGVEDRIVTWFGDILGGSVALDGRMDVQERPRHLFEKHESGLVFHVSVHRGWMHVVASPLSDKKPPTEITVAWSDSPNQERGRSLSWSATDGFYRHQVLRDGKWSPMRIKRAANRPWPGAARGDAIEMLIPIGKRGLGLTNGPDLRLMLTCGKISSGWRPLTK